jgi:hypothetical protein
MYDNTAHSGCLADPSDKIFGLYVEELQTLQTVLRVLSEYWVPLRELVCVRKR